MQEVKTMQLRIDSNTLKAHFEARATRLSTRATQELERAQEYRKTFGKEEKRDMGKFSGYSTSRDGEDPAENMLGKARDYDKRAARFAMLAKYIIPDVQYVISENEADSLELQSQFRRNLVLE